MHTTVTSIPLQMCAKHNFTIAVFPLNKKHLKSHKNIEFFCDRH